MDDEKIVVPASAVLWTGPRSLVYVKDPGAQTPRFEVREVELGPRTGDHYIIESGLEEGEEVVFNGNFRIDSEFQLSDRFSMMNQEPGTRPVPARQQGDAGVISGNQPGTQTNPVTDSFDDVPDDFREMFTEAIDVYLNGKDALVESDLADAQSAYESFISKLEEIGIHGLSGEGHIAWMESYEKLVNHASELTAAKNLDAARISFRNLSEELILAVVMFGIDGVVYHQYCPMAFGDEGGDWLSREEQIQNPYLPETMLICGEVVKRLE
jgi:Cu(I)/Ag(I) efflux system membrane fusion protein